MAGRFYPGRARTLAQSVDALLATATVAAAPVPKAIVVPHAGYAFSGPIAASAYARLAPARTTVRRVVLLGPAHRVALDGLAAPKADILRTPLGDVAIDVDARGTVAALPHVAIDDAPHAGEHSLEVHLPFLQRTFDEFSVLPLVVGVATAEEVAAVLDAVWGGPETLIVVSSDLSHYEPHERATAHDIRTVDAILAGRIDAIGPRDACGRFPLRGLLLAAAGHGLRPELLDRRTSGDTAGPRDRVVGYTAIVFGDGAG